MYYLNILGPKISLKSKYYVPKFNWNVKVSHYILIINLVRNKKEGSTRSFATVFSYPQKSCRNNPVRPATSQFRHTEHQYVLANNGI